MYNSRFSATTCGALQTVANPGLYSRAKEEAAAATSSGSLSIGPTALDMDSSTSQTTALTAAAAAWNFNVPPTVGPLGRRQSLFLIRRCTEHLMWTPTA